MSKINESVKCSVSNCRHREFDTLEAEKQL